MERDALRHPARLRRRRQPAPRPGHDRGRQQHRPRPGDPGPRAPRGREGHRQRRGAGQVHDPRPPARAQPARAARCRGRVHDLGALPGEAATTGREAPRRRRLGGARRRRHRRGPAARGADLVPLQRPAGQQGAVRHHGDRAPRLHGRRQRHPGRPEPTGQHRHLGLRAGPADGDLPRDRADRPLRRCATWSRTSPMQAAVPADAGPGFEDAFGRQARDDGRLHRAVRPLPLLGVRRRGDRGRPRDPAGVAGPVHLRPQLPDRRLGRRAAGRARAGAPVVRQQRDAERVARHLAARGLRLLRGVALVRAVRR